MFSGKIKLILFALFPFVLSAQDVAQWTIFEDVRQAARDYENPLQDLSAEVVFTAPSGRTTIVPAFWDYNRDWRVRFSPDELGVWRYQWRTSDASSQLGGHSGSMTCVPYQGGNSLYRHGAVAVAQGGRHFAHADGRPFFWLGDTAWNGVLLSAEADWEVYLRDRVRKRFSVIQFVALPWRSASGNLHGRPAFYGREKVAIDPIFFQHMDDRVEAINRQGLLAAIVMFWTHSTHVDLNPGMLLPEDQLIVLGRYLIARYGAYHTTWLLGGDGAYVGERADRWRRVGQALFGEKAPGIRRPVTMHATYWCADAFASESWWDFNGYQSGHDRMRGLERVTQGEPTAFWQNDSRPVLNLEPNYEAHRNRAPNAEPSDVFDALDVRRQAWLSLLSAPPAGLTYGAHGIWGWHPRAEEPMTHPYTGIGPAWRDAMDLEGSHNLRVLAELFADLDWTSLRPAQALLARQPGETDVKRWVAIAQGSGFALAYTADGEPIELRQEVRAARWHSPRTGEVVDARAGDTTFTPPSKKDWVLWLGLP